MDNVIIRHTEWGGFAALDIRFSNRRGREMHLRCVPACPIDLRRYAPGNAMIASRLSLRDVPSNRAYEVRFLCPCHGAMYGLQVAYSDAEHTSEDASLLVPFPASRDGLPTGFPATVYSGRQSLSAHLHPRCAVTGQLLSPNTGVEWLSTVDSEYDIRTQEMVVAVTCTCHNLRSTARVPYDHLMEWGLHNAGKPFPVFWPRSTATSEEAPLTAPPGVVERREPRAPGALGRRRIRRYWGGA